MSAWHAAAEDALSHPTYVKSLSAMDTREAHTHQYGIYLTKAAARALFGLRQEKGTNEDVEVEVDWVQAGMRCASRAFYYGVGTRNESRITRNIYRPGLIAPDDTGSLLVLSLVGHDGDAAVCRAHVLKAEEEIDGFLDALDLSPAVLPALVGGSQTAPVRSLETVAARLVEGNGEFPSTVEISEAARKLCNIPAASVRRDPDAALMEWVEVEYDLFKLIERRLTGPDAWRDLVEVDDFVHLANSIANRRKSRAGSSLENQLKAVFDTFSLAYTFQARTEGRKRPDFLFPSEGSYHDPDFPTDGLTMLASKTTCKDRWRQVINEADRLRDSWKHLFTLQQGVSANQLREMEGERVRLVAPRGNLKYFAAEMRPMVRTLGYFTELVSSRQERLIRDGHPIP